MNADNFFLYKYEPDGTFANDGGQVGAGKYLNLVESYAVWFHTYPFQNIYLTTRGTKVKVYDSFTVDSGVVVFKNQIGFGHIVLNKPFFMLFELFDGTRLALTNSPSQKL